MDYKYIEQLMERYFAGETSLQEEQILNAFFSQDEVPESLKEFQPLFAWKQVAEAEEQLDEHFDERLLAMIEAEDDEHESATVVQMADRGVKARTVTLSQRLMPLFRAAAVVAIILTLGNDMRFSMNMNSQATDEINYADYKDTFDDPAVAYDQVEDALQLMSEGFSLAGTADSLMPGLHNQYDSLRKE